jgi:flagellar hook-associated protein 3 FlgL
MVDRIATYSQSGSLLKELMRLQSSYATATLQEASGLKSDTYDGIGKDTQRLLNLESEYSEITSQSENAQVALDRVNIMYSNVGTMLNLLTDGLTNITQSLGGSTVDGSYLSAKLQQGMEEFSSRLNVQLNGTYLFAGGASSAPVNINDPDYNLAVDAVTVDAAYYQGSDYVAQVQASSDLVIEYGVAADSSGFEKALRAYNLALSNPEDQSTLQDAYNLMNEAFEEINTTQTILSGQATTLDDQVDENTETLNLLDTMIGDIKNADLAETTMKLAELETQIEASYAIATKLLQLNLYDYIK